ncbi:Ig-like domain-containing protein [soil metagenome]
MIATAAIVSTGYTAQRLDLGDGTVWVANSQQQAIGRANSQVLELNTVVESTGNDLDVLQSGSTVLLLDRTENKVEIIDPATSEIADTVALPPNQPEVYLAGDRVVILEQGTGELWILGIADLTGFDAESESSLSLGVDAIVSLDPSGLLYAYSPSAGLIYRVNAATSDTVESSQAVDFGGSDRLSITSVAGRWVVLDSDEQVLYIDGRNIDLADAVGSGNGPVLQWPTAVGDRILVGYSGGLIAVPASGGTPRAVVEGQAGVAARPLAFDDCEFAAWTNGESWRQCESDEGEPTTQRLATIPANAQLSYLTNGPLTVLNDRRSGKTWAVQRSSELIDNWDDLIVNDDDQPEEQQNDENLPPQEEKVQLPPIAVDDAFGARPGRSTVLPVLLNDYDPNGDVLIVSELTPINEAVGRIDLINERQQIQLTLAPGASGSLSFDYLITDGRGGSATGTVIVAIRAPGENSPPEQVRSTKVTAQSGGRITNQVLGDWVDPDGDAFYLTSASVAVPDAVSYKPEGTIVYSDSGAGSDLKIVTLVVSDGTDESSGSVSVNVKAAGEVPIVADPFVMLAYAGQEITVAPLTHVRGGNGTIRLNSVPAKTDVTITPSYETGTFRFTSDTVKSYYLEYVVTDGTQTVTGLVRIDVASPPNANTKPITVPKTVFVQTLRNERIDVAGTDVDPAGGVLLVTGIMNLAANSGVRAEVLEQRIVRVSLDAPLDDGPVTFNYRISNGLAEAEGVITVIEIPTPTRVQPPIAYDDTVTVRVGEAIDIPVLTNDEHPDGLELSLLPKLDQQLPPNSGLLFASGRLLRYLAPDKTGNFTAAYTVTGPDGQAATALVRIAVREADVATNNPPVPATVTARVIAGETVRVKIPLAGTDPDGDSVQLLGQSNNPERGSVISVESDTIVYQAGDYSAGTDIFTYTVIDSLGARSTGTVRIGISPRLEGARNPVAIVDVVTVRPGFTVSVQVLANDSDPDGSPLTIVSAEPNDDETEVEIIGDVIDVTPPRTPGSYGVIYAIENDKGGSSQNFIRVTVDPTAPLAYPVASDTVLTLSDVLDRDRVEVDVLANVFFADGDARDLGLSIYPGYGSSAQVTANKRVEVTVGDKSQIIPFKVTHPEDPTVFSYAFIQVPGYSDALPQIDRRADALRVVSEQELVIDLNDYVIAVGGKQVMLTDANTVRATHSNGANLVIDDDTLVYQSADKYFGPASISFEVTDGTSANDPNGRKSILVLPITVLPRENQPPDFNGAVIDFEPGQEKIIDLLKLTSYPYPDDLDELEYTVLSPFPERFTYTLNGSLLTLRANDNAVKGSTTAMSLAVRDSVANGEPGRIELAVVQSTRPLLKPAPDSAIVKRGTTASVDVLANDEATNPFPGQPMRVMDIRGLDGGGLPPGITIEPSANGSTLTVTASGAATPGDVNLQYQVADATDDPDRYVWGTITVSIQDRPDAVSNLAPTGFGDRTITMRWNAGPFNNSPITNYRVTSTLGGTVVDTTNCTGTTCTIRTPGNGPNNGVIVSVVATNAIGDSDPYTLGSPVWSDIIPPAPTSLSATPLDHGLRISWNEVTTPAGGSAVQSYLLTVGGVTVNPSAAVCGGGTCTTDVVDGSLANGVAVSYTVSARNGAYTALSVWNTSEPQSGVPAGPPIAVASPLATATSDTSIAVDWGTVFNNNGRAISSYWAAAYTGGAPTCSPDGTVNANGATVIATGTGTSAGFGSLAPNGTYSIIVFAFNGQGCSPSPAVIAHTAPPIIDSVAASLVPSGDGTWDFQFDGGSIGGGNLGSGEYTILYSLSGGGAVGGERGPIGVGGLLTADGSQYGSSVTVSARACRSYDSIPVCQAVMSSGTPLGMPVNANLSGVTFTPEGILGGTFSWLGYPSGSYGAVEYSCSGQGWTSVSDWNNTPGGSCAASGLLQVQLDVRVSANGTSYIKTYYGTTIGG